MYRTADYGPLAPASADWPKETEGLPLLVLRANLPVANADRQARPRNPATCASQSKQAGRPSLPRAVILARWMEVQTVRMDQGSDHVVCPMLVVAQGLVQNPRHLSAPRTLTTDPAVAHPPA